MTNSNYKLTDLLLQKSSPEDTEPLLSVKVTSIPRSAEVTAASASTGVNPWATFINGIYNGASNLANLLPTGTFLAFTAIAPVVTDNGTCDEPFELYSTITVLVFFALFCIFSCFTDSYQAADAKVYYGLVTLRGLWTPQLPVVLHPGDKEEYKLTFIDLIHSTLSLAVLAACALVTPNIKACFYPNLSESTVRIIPVLVGFVASTAFVTFPSKRHGIGFPVTPASFSSTSKDIVFDPEQASNSASSKGAASTPSVSTDTK